MFNLDYLGHLPPGCPVRGQKIIIFRAVIGFINALGLDAPVCGLMKKVL